MKNPVRKPLDECYCDLDMGVPDRATCPSCQKEQRVFALSGVIVDGVIEAICCTNCLTDLQRVAKAEEDGREAKRLAKEEPWNTEAGKLLKIERNRRIEAARWATDADTSPLTTACRARWRDYIRALHRITIDFSEPTLVEWPEEPDTEYPA